MRRGTGGAKVDSGNVLAPASSMTDVSSSKEKAIKEREDGRKTREGAYEQRNGATLRDYRENMYKKKD